MAEKTLRELSRIDRPLRALLEGVVPPSSDCREIRQNEEHLFEVRWKCNVDPKERGRKQIIGVEIIDFDRASRVLTYSATFDVASFSDQEPLEKAHRESIRRSTQITFKGDRTSTAELALAQPFIAQAARKGLFTTTIAASSSSGSNYRIKASGQLQTHPETSKTIVSIDPGMTATLEGEVWGEDELRGSKLSSGSLELTAPAGAVLESQGLCSRLNGRWQAVSRGNGETLKNEVISSESGVESSDGGSTRWGSRICSGP